MPAETPTPQSPKRVLYVSADSSVTPLTEALDRGPGRFEVVVETDPRETLSRLETNDVDCVVSEYNHSGMDGVKLLKTVREPYPNLPFILFPEAGSEATASRAISAGVTEYVRADANEKGVESLAARIRDITHTPQSASDRRYDWAQLSRFIEAFPDVVFVINEAGRYLDVIASGSSSLLYSDPERLLGEQFQDVLPEATADRFTDVVQEVLNADEQQRIEYQLDVQSGARWFEARVGPLSTGGQQQTVFWIARDVTERKRREQEYEQIFNGVNDAISVHDPETGEMLAVNDSLCDLTGYDRDELLRRGAEAISVNEEGYTGDQAMEFIRSVAETGGPRQTEWKVETREGDVRWLETSGTMATVGGERRYIALNRDVTERKRRKQEYERIFNGVNDTIAIHHGDTGEMLAVNRQMCKLTGYDRDRVLDLGAEGLLHDHPDQDYAPEEFPALISRVIDGEEVGPYEQALETSDGEIRWVEVNPTRATIGGEQRFLAISRDITETRRKKHDYEEIFNNVNDAIAVFDPDTNEIMEVNEAYREMLGYDDLDVIREQGIDGLSANDEAYTGERGWELIHEVAETGESVTVEWRADTKAGDRIWLESTLTPAEIGGELSVLSIQRDISDRKHREQRLEVFNRILRHNLRNKLDVIRSHAETLADRSTLENDHTERIVAATDELATIGAKARKTDQIMSMNEDITEVDLIELLDEVIEVSGVDQRVSEVTTDLPASAELMTNRDALHTALNSALENAIEHTDSEVSITVETTSQGYSIAVEDDGPGIPEEQLVPIEAGTETDLSHGRGLGLWQLRWGVEKFNGELSFETKAGTTVRVSVPDRSNPNRES